MPQNKLEAILKLLEPFSNPDIPIAPAALKRLGSIHLNEFYNFLINASDKPKKCVHRPKCPIKDYRHSSLARFPYKKGMADYIAQWGYKFENPCNVTPSLREATANYLARR